MGEYINVKFESSAKKKTKQKNGREKKRASERERETEFIHDKNGTHPTE